MQIIQARQAAEFALTPVGQTVKQFEVMQRMAQMYTTSTIIPETYRGNLGNCVIALDIYSALRYRKRNLGKLGKVKYNDLEYKTDASGRNRKTIVVKELDGTDIDNIECVAYATELSTGEVLESDPVTIEMAIKEGWYTKSGSKWVTMPSLMLTYRAAAFWQRMYCPEISMGFLTKEEADDIQDAEIVDETKPRRTLRDIAAEAAGLKKDPAPEDKDKNADETTGGGNVEPGKVNTLW